ncbi:helix-turn-helix domain-containing protein [Stackebrandtia nassauensis]|uniref:DUF5753 domain-containing protein n=1 Tax=Stackebrandtia nassauensis (strain DSM 44728 / CIP 108903 / NRRL B-16338 / NBRC 102104 / LLR-40K-21) TaxID=446470 RepID=D3QBX8_STANL|nr:helix-turn-helix transcriptional regulator [Stackebrandtia nassauensis]ADD44867.1 hypothetical protein Snas_5233 [Stackebrandtia nassauensis DSM 44728]
MTDNPLLTRKQLGKMLRELRLSSGKTVEDIEYFGKLWKKSKLYAIENGHQPNPSWPEVEAVAKFLGASNELTRELVRMAKACLNSGWYVPFDISQKFQTYLDLESAANRLHFVEIEMVNGLFQTENYTRALQRALGVPEEKIQNYVDFRMQRAQRFWNRDPFPEVTLLMSEGTLRRVVGGAEVMAEQVDHLRELARRDLVDIVVIPFAAGLNAAMQNAFTLLEFNDDVYPEVAYVESRSECQYHERKPVVALYKWILQEALSVALPIGEIEL